MGKDGCHKCGKENNNGGTNDCALTLKISHSNTNGIQVGLASNTLSVNIHTQNAYIILSHIRMLFCIGTNIKK